MTSRENLLEMGEFYKDEMDDMVPERDSDRNNRKPRPKPRHGSNSRSKPPYEFNGKTNSAFSGDEIENENNSRNSWSWTGNNTTKKLGDTFDILSSSDESVVSGLRNKVERTPISVLSAVEVHSHSYDDRSGNSVNTVDEEEEGSLHLHYENETKRKIEAPKPKPRLRAALKSVSTSENESGRSTPLKPIPKSRNLISPPDAIEGSPKEEFLSVSIPENEIESMETQNKPETEEQTSTTQAKSSTGFLGMMKKARNFLSTKSSTSLSQSESKSGGTNLVPIEPMMPTPTPTVESPARVLSQKAEIKSSRFKSTNGAEEFELKPIQKRKSARMREAGQEETKSHDIQPLVLPNDDIPIVSTPKSSVKRENRRRESLTGITKLLGVTVHCSDMLPADPYILHPIVKVTVMDQNGLYLTRSEDLEPDQRPNSLKPRSRRRNDSIDESESEELENDGSDDRKISMSKSGIGDPVSIGLKKASILPIMTQAFEIHSQIPAVEPTWNELLVFEEPFERFVGYDSTVIFFFEIMDFLPMGNSIIRRGWGDYHGSEPGWYKIAWAFLKLVGNNGIRNVNRKLRLQLFKPEALSASERTHGVEVYCYWKLQKRAKINSTLYVTLKGIIPPIGAAASLRTLLTMRKEHLTQAILDSQLATTRKSKKKRDKQLEQKPGSLNLTGPQWTRHEGQSCKVPNKLLMSLPVSQVASLNLTVCGNVHSVKFSPDGLKLAAGLNTDELHIVLIFEIPSGTLLKNLRGHHGLIYDLDWRNLLVNNCENTNLNYLASASADSTVLVWKIGRESNCHLVKTFSHPSFVYCVKFHPTQTHLIATGCFDYIIRIWDFSANAGSPESTPEHSTTPLILLDRHFSFVNSIAFQPNGEFLFSGDGEGSLCKWKIASHNKRKWRLNQNIRLTESANHPINDIVMHPTGNRLLIQVRDSCLKIVDINSLLVLNTFTGLLNEKLQIRSCMSPCGNLVLSGSEDATLCIWDADTGRIMEFITPENHPNCVVTSVDYHPFDHYIVIGLSSVISESNPVMIYGYLAPEPIGLSVSTVAKLKSSLFRHRQAIEAEDQAPIRRNVTFAPNRGDSTDKFIKIIKKLDMALKVGKTPTKSSRTGIQSPKLERKSEQRESFRELQIETTEEIMERKNKLNFENREILSPKKSRASSPLPLCAENENNHQTYPNNQSQINDWSLSSISEAEALQSPKSPMAQNRPEYDSPVKNNTTPSSRQLSAAAKLTEEEVAIVEIRSELISPPESDTTIGSISSKREKRRRQIREGAPPPVFDSRLLK